jgi:hypothetical protein
MRSAGEKIATGSTVQFPQLMRADRTAREGGEEVMSSTALSPPALGDERAVPPIRHHDAVTAAALL